MPLTRQTVTLASRVMLPLYPVFAAVVGLSFVTTPRARLVTTPGLRYADSLVSLHLWGSGFLVVATVLVAALIARARRAYAFGLAVMCLWMLGWSALLLASAIFESSSPSAWAWPAFIATACWASMVSLLSREM